MKKLAAAESEIVTLKSLGGGHKGRQNSEELTVLRFEKQALETNLHTVKHWRATSPKSLMPYAQTGARLLMMTLSVQLSLFVISWHLWKKSAMHSLVLKEGRHLILLRSKCYTSKSLRYRLLLTN